LPDKGFGEAADKARRSGKALKRFFDIFFRPPIIRLFRVAFERVLTIPGLLRFAGDIPYRHDGIV